MAVVEDVRTHLGELLHPVRVERQVACVLLERRVLGGQQRVVAVVGGQRRGVRDDGLVERVAVRADHLVDEAHPDRLGGGRLDDVEVDAVGDDGWTGCAGHKVSPPRSTSTRVSGATARRSAAARRRHCAVDIAPLWKSNVRTLTPPVRS